MRRFSVLVRLLPVLAYMFLMTAMHDHAPRVSTPPSVSVPADQV